MFLDVLMGALSVRNDDSRCLFTLCLLLAMTENEGKYTCYMYVYVEVYHMICHMMYHMTQVSTQSYWKLSLSNLSLL